METTQRDGEELTFTTYSSLLVGFYCSIFLALPSDAAMIYLKAASFGDVFDHPSKQQDGRRAGGIVAPVLSIVND